MHMGAHIFALTGSVALLALSGCGRNVTNEVRDQALPGLTYESLRALPDWSGWWSLQAGAGIAALESSPPPMKSADWAKLQSARNNPEGDVDRNRFCKPETFVGVNIRPGPGIEFLFTPGRVTLTNELGFVRRIYTDGRAVPTDRDESNAGSSIGHWEGQTLVVETVAINPNAKFPDSGPGSLPIGRNAKVTERIGLNGERLDIDVVVVAPDILTAPYHRVFSYARNRKQYPDELVLCVAQDRAIDPATGKQRFDLTPPADLPPPPPR